ncbi:MAG: mechanosensitive ion channel [Acidobacteria bacterium]|nr:mechanosensitive ion channel [Acidobacteriota bacterium]
MNRRRLPVVPMVLTIFVVLAVWPAGQSPSKTPPNPPLHTAASAVTAEPSPAPGTLTPVTAGPSPLPEPVTPPATLEAIPVEPLPGPKQSHTKEARPEPAGIVVANRTVAVLRCEWRGYSPAQRAAAAMDRIAELVEADVTGPVRLARVGDEQRVFIADKAVFNLHEGDLDLLLEQTLEQAGAETESRLREALEAIREQRRPRIVLEGVALSLLAVVICAFLAWLCVKGYRRLDTRFADLSPERLKDLDEEVGKILVRPLRMVLNMVYRLALVVAVVALVNMCVTFCLRRFPLTRPWGDEARGVVLNALAFVGRGVWAALPGLLVVVIIVFLARLVSRFIRFAFTLVEQRGVSVPCLNLYPDTAPSMRRLIMIVLWALTLVLVYPYLPGSDSEVFKALGIFAGLLISLGSSGLVSQLISGFILVFSRVFTVGDYVRVGEVEGTVTTIGMVSTKVRTIQREEVNIPNNVLLGGTSTNFSRLVEDKGVIVYTSVTIGYDTPWRQVHAMLLEAVARTAGLKKEPAPFVIQTALSDFYVEYQVNAYLQQADQRIFVLAELHARIQDTFNENGVQIMSPHYLGDPAGPKVVPPANWHAPPARSGGEDHHPRLPKD